LLALAGLVTPASAVSVTGTDWLVHFNLPDQSSSAGNATPDEYAIRDALVARINALQTGNSGWLATYTLSSSSMVFGGAGPIVNAMEGALNRGARVAFVVDNGVDTNAFYNGTSSLGSLALRATNPLVLAQSPAAAEIMHDKLGVFDYGSTARWVFVASWNFTAAASANQWNIGLEMRSDQLFTAYTNEFAQFLAGRFNNDPGKSHAHDNSIFSLAGSWGTNVVRFAPYPNGNNGGNNAQTDITNLISRAREQIVFALNSLTRMYIATSLVQAANRGVLIYGSMPTSDTDPGGGSDVAYTYLTNTASYATTNRVHFLPAYREADYSSVDSGQSDLIHAKYMVIDPYGTNPVLVHGSANWTDAALVADDGNDENLVILRHRDIARMFYASFKRITGAFQDRSDFWLQPLSSSVRLWMTDTNVVALEQASAVTGIWSSAQIVTGRVGFLDAGNVATGGTTYLRLQQ
jgi:phosphatidylserine/phosphatidylglycerophosphate/cardiolipin synthase-like enzyme